MANEARRDGGRRGREGGRRDDRRERRAQQREAHTARMAERYAAEIARACADTREVEGMPKAAAPKAAALEEKPVHTEEPAVEADEQELSADESAGQEGAAELEVAVPAIHVLAEDAVTAILENGRGRAQFCDMAVIDFASFTNPGSGFDKGYMGQEQTLCDASFLYNVLDQKRGWYAQNRRRNVNCELYRDRALVVPAVCFSRERIHAYADVIVTAAPNVRRARSEYNVAQETLADAMRDRIRFALAVADSLGREKVVLGALGCDTSGWEAGEVAEMLRAELADGAHAAREVFIAVPQERNNDNAARFEHAFVQFPRKNDVPYEDVLAARAAKAQAAESEDDEDDDWRKYL